MKTALVTGGCGFIGRHFTKKLVELGYSVTVVDNLISNSSLKPLEWPLHLKCEFQYYEDNILNFLEQNNIKFNLIIHAAAIVGGRETIENDPFLISRNIHIDNELFRWIEKNGCDNLVYFSSSAVYPVKYQTTNNYKKLSLSDLSIQDNNIFLPDLTYGWSKLTGEFSLSILAKRVNTTISIYRPFSGYGEDQDGSYPFPSIMKKSLSSSDTIEIWSDAVRDFVYIDDIVEYVLNTCFHDKKLIINNIGTGRSTSMSELANLMISILPNCIQKTIKILDDKPKGVYYRVSDGITDYNWTTLEEGILKSYKLNYPS